ncbi:MAG: hypothetical protein GC149_04070 [Gammaproteobacteria bacterium]|nr:hypothetical protein [Gammaproteobacteria bacterium]
MRHSILFFVFPLLLGIARTGWSASPSLLVGLHIQSTRMDLQYADSVRKTDLSRLDLVWDQTLNSVLEGSISIGFIDLTQSGNPIPAGQSTSGNSLGLGLRVHLYRGDRLHLHADMNYQYADTSADVSGQKVDISWHQLTGEIQADIRVYQYSYLSLAVGSLAINGDESATGTVTAAQTFKNDQSAYGRLGVLLGVDQASHIGIEVSSGSVAGGRIFFQRWF